MREKLLAFIILLVTIITLYLVISFNGVQTVKILNHCCTPEINTILRPTLTTKNNKT